MVPPDKVDMKGIKLMSGGGAESGGDCGSWGDGENRGENRRNHHFFGFASIPALFHLIYILVHKF